MLYTTLGDAKQFGHLDKQQAWMDNERRSSLIIAAIMKEYIIDRLVLSPKTCKEIGNHYMNRWTLSIRATEDGGLEIEYKDESRQSDRER